MTLEPTIGFLLLLLSDPAGSKKCTNSHQNTLSNKVDFVCPGDEDRDSESQVNNQVDPWFFKILSISVIAACLLLTLLLILCCFWSKCPLYNTCRANYNSSNVVMYSLAEEEDPLRLMPNENFTGSRYIPCKVKVRVVEDV